MTWHFVEVWGILLVAFAAGCVLGTLLYMALAASPLARLQVAAADAIDAAAVGIRSRLSLGRDLSIPPAGPAPQSRLRGPGGIPAGGYATTQAAEWLDPAEPVEEDVEANDAAFDEGNTGWEGEGYWDGEAEEGIDAYPPTMAGMTAISSVRPAPAPEPDSPAMRPLTLPGPRNGVADNLQRIRGIGEKNEALLNSLGIYHFGQIAAWTPAEARWVASHLSFPERLERDDWIGQAIILATGGDTGYVKAAERRKGGDEAPTEDTAL